MAFARGYAWVIGVWVIVLGGSAVAVVAMQPGYPLTVLGNLTQCLVPLLANAGLLLSTGSPHPRRNTFWMLLALASTLWMVGQFEWSYREVYLHERIPDLYAGDILFFLRGIPFLAALALQPHRRRADQPLGFGFLDFALLLMWWMYVYVYAVLPWIYALPYSPQYNRNVNLLANLQDLLIVSVVGYFWARSRGAWRTVYAHLFGAASLYLVTVLLTNVAIDEHRYYTGSWYDLLLIASFLWLGTAGVVAYRYDNILDVPADEGGAKAELKAQPDESVLVSRTATAAVLSLPLFAIWTLRFGEDPPAIRDFRLLTTLLALLPLASLVFLRQRLTDADRIRLLRRSEKSIENLRRLQAQLVQSEKLASLGQLAAGAAHEINNPLTAILGFSDLLAEDTALPEKTRGIASKIREQARRTKELVGNLMSFARPVPAERTLLDINAVVNKTVQLRALGLRGATRIDLQLQPDLPRVRGDGNQLMQVFFNILSNAIDAMETPGGVLTIKTFRDGANVVAFFSDTGPGVQEPHRVFDPFYTTKPVGRGTGLGLSTCYGLVQEHGGSITCYNRPEGGAVFRVELPMALPAFQTQEPQPAAATPDPAKTR